MTLGLIKCIIRYKKDFFYSASLLSSVILDEEAQKIICMIEIK